MTARTPRPSLYAFAGGEPAMLALAAAHHRRCLEEPEISHAFSHGVRSDHVARLAAYWAEVLGGPSRFSEAYGGHSAMLELHARTGAGADWGERFLACFLAAVADAGLPDDAELRAALRSYMEWATADVVSYAPRDSRVPAGMAVPRWGWDGLEAPTEVPG